MVSRSFIHAEFPELEWIRDPDLREKCVDVLQKAFSQGGWDENTVSQCPIAVEEMRPDCPVKNLEHIHDVLHVCKAMCDWYLPRYNFIDCDPDIVIAAALLHDSCKYTEYTWREGKPAYADNSKYMRHPLAGAILAAHHGLPDKLVQVIATHSFEGEGSYLSPEGHILKLADKSSFGLIHLTYHS